ncbi:Ig domain-containing protein, partial [bacterium]
IKGTPQLKDNSKDREIYKFSIQVDVGDTTREKTDTKEYQITVLGKRFSKLAITTAEELPTAIYGRNYPLTFSAEGGSPPFRWSLISGQVQGLNLTSNGILEGTVSAAKGSYNISVKVTDQFNNTDSKDFKITVDEIEECPDIPTLKMLTNSLPDANAGNSYEFVFAAEGGLAPYEWDIIGEVPGLESSQNGILQGTANQEGEFYLDVSVKSSDGQETTSKQLCLKVLPAVPDITPIEIVTKSELPDIEAQQSVSYALSATGGMPPYHWQVTDAGNIGSSTFLNEKGTLSFHFKEAGEYQFTAMVKDAAKQEKNKKFTLQVNPSIPPLRIEMDRFPTSVHRYRYHCNLNAWGGYPPYLWTISDETPLPAGLTLEQGRIKGSPESAWRGWLQISVEDVIGQKDSKKLALEILESGEGAIVPKLDLLTESIPTLLTSEECHFKFTTQGGGYPLEWQLTGDLPKGLVFNDGELSGKPWLTAEAEIHIRVQDPIGQSAENTYQLRTHAMVDAKWFIISIVAGIVAIICLITLIIIYIRLRASKKSPLIINTASVPNARCSFPYKVYLAASGGIPPYKWTVIKGELPPGLELQENGIIEGVPFKGIKVNDVQEVSFEVKVTDSIGNTVTQEL